MRRRPCSGRTAARSNSGRPDRREEDGVGLQARRQRLVGGTARPHSRIPGPPKGSSSISSGSGSARSARIASLITSGPMPSPPRQTPSCRFHASDQRVECETTQRNALHGGRDERSACRERRTTPEVDSEFAMLVDGEWVPPDVRRDLLLRRPLYRGDLGAGPLRGHADVDRAVRAARRAFDEDGWPHTTAASRAGAAPPARPADRGQRRRADQAQIRENGKLISEMRPASTCSSGLLLLRGARRDAARDDRSCQRPELRRLHVREPIGVVAAITPWNTPLGLLGWKLFPALAAGNTVVVKPSEVTPTSTLALAELVVEAGFPRGVVNVVTGLRRPDRHCHWSSHPGCRQDRVHRLDCNRKSDRAAAASERNARVSLELGGKSPQLIFADADLDNAVNGVMAGVFAATGQTCMAGSRVLSRGRRLRRVAELLVTVRGRSDGGSARSGRRSSDRSPPERSSKRCSATWRSGSTRVCDLLTGGARLDRTGFFVEPTVFGDVDNSSRLAREEIFGPVVCLIRFRDEDEAVPSQTTPSTDSRPGCGPRTSGGRIGSSSGCVPAPSGSTTTA